MPETQERKKIVIQENETSPDKKEVTQSVDEKRKPWYKRRLIAIPLFLIVGGAIFLFLFDNVLMPFYVKSSDVATVPSVVGMKTQPAIAKLEEAGYEPEEYERRFDEKVPEGVVIRQTPEPGEETKPGRTVYLVVSGGKEMAVVPDLKGRSVRDAKMLLLKANLSIGEITATYSETAPNGTIFQQAPSPGAKINSSTKVNIVVSQGPLYGRVPVPTLRGLSLSDAISTLNSSKLVLGKVTFENRPDGAPNTVVEQYPVPGDLIIEGSTVDLFVIRENSGSSIEDGREN